MWCLEEVYRCYCDRFSGVNVYFNHLKFCVVCINNRRYVVVNVMLSLMSVMSPPPALCILLVRTAVKLCILGVSGIVMMSACVS